MTDTQPKTLIIGGGHNGLVCAAYLARAGQDVTVLEATEHLGGAAATREFAPGFQVSAGAHLLYLLDAGIKKELALDSHGLKLAAADLSTIALDVDGQFLRIKGAQLDGPGAAPEDQEALVEYERMMARFAGIIGRLNNRKPMRVGTTKRSDLMALARLGLDIRRMGKADMREFLRIAGINVFDVLQEFFVDERLKGALSLDGVLGTFLGTRSNNSVFCALHRRSQGGSYDLPAGGMGRVSEAIAAAARSAGADIRTGCRVKRVLLDFDRVCGVELEDGEVIEAERVVSNADPKQTFSKLLGAEHLEAGFAHRIHNIRSNGCAAKLHLALDELPEFSGLPREMIGERLLVAPSLQYVEHAFNHAKYGEFSASPVMEITIPTVHDPQLAPEGKHVLSAVVQWAPHNLKQGWSEAKVAFTGAVMDVLAQYDPAIRSKTRFTEMLTPADLEASFGMTGGHWHHAEMTMDQFMMMRPVPGAAQYETPVSGLWLCGAGSHPGGGVMGCAGRNAARTMLETGRS
jgi:phytoene dehydrogenase-like protein